MAYEFQKYPMWVYSAQFPEGVIVNSADEEAAIVGAPVEEPANQAEDAEAPAAPRKGRPPGSKNKPKEAPVEAEAVPADETPLEPVNVEFDP